MGDMADVAMRRGSGAALYALSENVGVIVCDVASRLRTPPKLETLVGPAPSPLTSLRLATTDGGTRVIWAFRRPPDRDLIFRAFAGILAHPTLLEVSRGEKLAPVDLAALAACLEPEALMSFVSALLGVWSSAFKLRRTPGFSRAMISLVDALSARPAIARAEASIGAGQMLMGAELPEAIGDVQAIYAVTGDRMDYGARRWLLGAPGKGGGRALTFVARAGSGERIVVVCTRGIAVRLVRQPEMLPDIGQWWRGKARGGDLRLREFVVRVLADGSEAGRAAAVELQLRAPLKPRQLRGQAPLPAASVEVALQGPSGLLVAGWLRDPAGFIEGLGAEDENGTLHPVTLHRFPGPPVAKGQPETIGFVGFAAGCKSEAPLVQPRLELRLSSGPGQSLIPRPQPVDPVERRAIALRMVPPRHMTDAILEECLAPALTDLQKAAMAGRREPTVETIGAPLAEPAISVIVPLYRNLEFMRAQVAAFALDPGFASAVELIYVLDSPEQAGDVRSLLQGLNILYGVPFTLVVMPRNMGYAAANNAGATIARGEMLVLVNSDVIPARPGWAQQLALRLTSAPRVGACGAKLLFEDGSIQHAGMYFSRSYLGRWLNHHYFKGMPREYPGATEARLVPAVTGACLAIRRDVYAYIGGFTEDYVIGDFEDSDLCLKLHAAGYDIGYVPRAELYHLERQSIRHNEDYMRGNADRYNGWLHAARWGDVMAALMSDAASTPDARTRPLVRSAA